VEKTNEEGFVHYEISNFGRPNFFSKHNTSYWQGKPYLGIGPSAHSFNQNQRSWNVANNAKYIKSIQNNELPNTIETLSKKDQYNEYVMTGLRTIWGVSLNKIQNDFGNESLEYLNKTAEKFINNGLLVTSSEIDVNQNSIEKLITTQKGKFLVDGIASELFMI
jgi:oxygen-independent coproporphyrinogen-3 oxidase